jgi:hypothetical protein
MSSNSWAPTAPVIAAAACCAREAQHAAKARGSKIEPFDFRAEIVLMQNLARPDERGRRLIVGARTRLPAN